MDCEIRIRFFGIGMHSQVKTWGLLSRYLSFAQINGNMHGSKQLAHRKKDATGQESVLVEDNLYEVAASIPTREQPLI